MKIIFLHYGTLDGGDANGFTRSFNLAKGLATLNNEIVFFTTQKSGFNFPWVIENRDGVKIVAFAEILPYRFRKGGIAIFSAFLKAFTILFYKGDIVHTDTGHRISAGLPALVHRFFRQSKYVSEWWEHFGKGGIYDDMSLLYKCTVGLYDRIFEVRNRKSADGCVAISNQLKKRAISVGISSEKVIVLNGGCDIDKIKFLQTQYEIKKKYSFSQKSFNIGIIGINDEEFFNNINLFSAIKKIRADKNLDINVIATGKLSLKLYQKYGDFIKLYSWLPYDEFCELIILPDAFSLLQKDNLRNRSRFPNKLGDYLAASRPIIANCVGDVGHYINKYPDVFYDVNVDSENEIRHCIEILYDKSSNEEIDFRKIREVAVENSWLERSKTLNKFYRDI